LVLKEVLNAKEKRAIGPKLHFFHDILKRDKLLDIDITCVLVVLGSRIQVEYDDVSSESLSHLLHIFAVGGLEVRRELPCRSLQGRSRFDRNTRLGSLLLGYAYNIAN
jgi:hypothetical protein